MEVKIKDNQDAFITEMEKDIVLWRKNGSSFYSIAYKCGISEKQAKDTYLAVMERIRLLSNDLVFGKSVFPVDTISDFLDYLGVTKGVNGRDELYEAIKFSYENPELMSSMKDKFFPELGSKLNKSAVLVENRVRRAAWTAAENKNTLGTPAYVFFRLANLNYRHEVRLNPFFSAAWECIRELKTG